MNENGVRRIPLMEGERPVGLVTFDDLVVDGSVGFDALRDIVAAQLEVEAPQKPAGTITPRCCWPFMHRPASRCTSRPTGTIPKTSRTRSAFVTS
jgi:hypothetical protein